MSGNRQARSLASGRGQGKMEKTGCEIICGAPMTLAVKGQMMMMMMMMKRKIWLFFCVCFFFVNIMPNIFVCLLMSHQTSLFLSIKMDYAAYVGEETEQRKNKKENIGGVYVDFFCCLSCLYAIKLILPGNPSQLTEHKIPTNKLTTS